MKVLVVCFEKKDKNQILKVAPFHNHNLIQRSIYYSMYTLSIVGVFSLQTTHICLPNTSHFFKRNIQNLAKDKP